MDRASYIRLIASSPSSFTKGEDPTVPLSVLGSLLISSSWQRAKMCAVESHCLGVTSRATNCSLHDLGHAI